MTKHLPVILCAICIVIALFVVLWAPPLWPAALAIVTAGVALAIAVRAASRDRSAELIAWLKALQESNDELRDKVSNANTLIDELADVVEQVATVTADGSGSSQSEFQAVRQELASLRAAPTTASLGDDVVQRLSMLEAKLGMAAEQAEAVPNPEAERLRELIADNAKAPSPPPGTKTTLTPVFRPALGGPAAFILTPVGDETPANIPATLSHAAQIAVELQQGGRDVRLFLRLSPLMLSHLTVRRDILAAIDATPALQERLTLLTAQQGFDTNVQQSLSAFAERGCKFALEDVRDWSFDLSALARAGLSHIIVDGVVMMQSTKLQDGDPGRLAKALSDEGIALIGAGVASKQDIDSVRALQPALVTGDGLGKGRVVEAVQ